MLKKQKQCSNNEVILGNHNSNIIMASISTKHKNSRSTFIAQDFSTILHNSIKKISNACNGAESVNTERLLAQRVTMDRPLKKPNQHALKQPIKYQNQGLTKLDESQAQNVSTLPHSKSMKQDPNSSPMMISKLGSEKKLQVEKAVSPPKGLAATGIKREALLPQMACANKGDGVTGYSLAHYKRNLCNVFEADKLPLIVGSLKKQIDEQCLNIMQRGARIKRSTKNFLIIDSPTRRAYVETSKNYIASQDVSVVNSLHNTEMEQQIMQGQRTNRTKRSVLRYHPKGEKCYEEAKEEDTVVIREAYRDMKVSRKEKLALVPTLSLMIKPRMAVHDVEFVLPDIEL